MSEEDLTPNERWEEGVPHNEKSKEIYNFISKLDHEKNGDYFRFKSGGDGDNGEELMFLFDCFFEQEKKKNNWRDWKIKFQETERKGGWQRNVTREGNITELFDYFDPHDPNDTAELTQVLRLLIKHLDE